MELKIAVISTWKTRCGIATYSEALCHALADLGVEIYVVRFPRFGRKSSETMRDIAERVPRDKISLIHCFVEETPILTTNGLKNIEAVNQEDSLYTHTGKLGSVTHRFKRFYKGNIIQLRSKYSMAIKCTPEHPFLVVKKPWMDNHTTRLFRKRQRKRIDTPDLSPKWVPAEEIQIGDYIVFPRMKQIGIAENITMTDDLSQRDYYIDDGHILSKIGKSKLCKTTIKVTEEFCRLLGYYIAEGCSRDNQFRFSINKNEVALLADIELTLRSIGFQGNLSKATHGNGLTISCSGRPIVSMFRKLCGVGARNKHLPPWWYKLSDNQLAQLIKGIWIGDGTTTFDGFSITSHSKTLLEELRLAYNRLGVVASVYFRSIRVCGAGIKRLEELWSVSHPAKSKWGFRDFAYITDSQLFYRVCEKKEQSYEGYVYNFKVTPDNSYLILGYTAHNCQHEYGLFQALDIDFYRYLQALGKPLVTTMHAVGHIQLDPAIYQLSSKVIVHNKYCARQFRFPSVLIPHGVNIATCPPMEECKKAWGIDPRMKIVGYCGFIAPNKGLEVLLEVVAKLENVGLLIAGGWFTSGPDIQYINDLKQRSFSLLPNRCQWIGYVPDDKLSIAYGAMDMVAYPSLVATESGALLTAIGHGKPVLATSIPPFREKEEVGALMTFTNAEDMGTKIKQILDDAELRQKLEAGARKFSQENSWEVVARKHIELYESLLTHKDD